MAKQHMVEQPKSNGTIWSFGNNLLKTGGIVGLILVIAVVSPTAFLYYAVIIPSRDSAVTQNENNKTMTAHLVEQSKQLTVAIDKLVDVQAKQTELLASIDSRMKQANDAMSVVPPMQEQHDKDQLKAQQDTKSAIEQLDKTLNERLLVKPADVLESLDKQHADAKIHDENMQKGFQDVKEAIENTREAAKPQE